MTPALGRRLQQMVSFRNLAEHSYREIEMSILRRVLDDHLGDFEDFLAAMAAASR